MSIKIITCSDTHRSHWDVKVPEGDIFIFAGDNDITDLITLHDFNDWLGTIDVNLARIVIGGNHDFLFQSIGKEWCKKLLTNCIYLENESIEIGGFKIWGSPYSPYFNNWAFMLPDNMLEEIWATIPLETEILVTHTMPYGILDKCGLKMESVGSFSLKERIKEIQPKIFIGGHLHESAGKYTDYKTDYYNVSVMDEQYNIVNPCTIIEV